MSRRILFSEEQLRLLTHLVTCCGSTFAEERSVKHPTYPKLMRKLSRKLNKVESNPEEQFYLGFPKVEVPSDRSKRIFRLRMKMGLTQSEFAGLVGVSFVTVNRWENSQTKPSILAWENFLKLEKKNG